MAGLFFASFFSGISGAAVLTGTVLCFAAIGRYRGLVRADFILAAAVFVLASGYITVYGRLFREPVTAYDGTRGTFSGKVTGINEHSGGRTEHILSGRINGRTSARVLLYTDDLGVRYGDSVSIADCTFAVPENTYLYNTADRLRSERVYITLEDAEGINVEKRSASRLRNALADYRGEICEKLRHEIGEDEGGFLAGMLFGKSSGAVDAERRTVFSRCGIAHILAVSGLHISIAAAALMWLLRFLRANRFAAFAAMNAVLVLLILMTDQPVSAVRAAIMADMICAARLFRRQGDVFTSLSAAVLIICIVDPYAIYSAGFLLSVAGTFGIGVFAPYMTAGLPDKGLKWLAARSFLSVLCANLCIMPLCLKYFDGISLIAPLTNMLLLPLCAVLLIAGYVFTLTGGALTFLLIPAKYLSAFILGVSGKLAGIRGICFNAGGGAVVLTAFVSAAAAVLFHIIVHNRRFTAYASALAFCTVLAGSLISGHIRSERFILAVLGSGRNTAVVVTFHGRADVIDLSGNYKCPDYVRKYLSQNGFTDVRALYLTRNAPSQYSAYRESLESMTVGSFNAGGSIFVQDEEYNDWDERGFSYSGGDYTLSFDRGSLSAEYGDCTVSIVPAGTEEVPQSGLLLYYGGKKSDDTPEGKHIGVNFDNNSEIILSSSGGYTIRRL